MLYSDSTLVRSMGTIIWPVRRQNGFFQLESTVQYSKTFGGFATDWTFGFIWGVNVAVSSFRRHEKSVRQDRQDQPATYWFTNMGLFTNWCKEKKSNMRSPQFQNFSIRVAMLILNMRSPQFLLRNDFWRLDCRPGPVSNLYTKRNAAPWPEELMERHILWIRQRDISVTSASHGC